MVSKWSRKQLEVVLRNGDVDQAARVLKKKLDKDGVKSAWKLRSIPKPSERRREKEGFRVRLFLRFFLAYAFRAIQSR
jgi:ribosomal protein S21